MASLFKPLTTIISIITITITTIIIITIITIIFIIISFSIINTDIKNHLWSWPKRKNRKEREFGKER